MALPLLHLLCPFFIVIVVTFIRFFSRILQNFRGTLVAFLLFYYPVHLVLKLFLSWGWRSQGWKGVLCPFILIALTLTTLLGHILHIFEGILITFLLFYYPVHLVLKLFLSWWGMFRG